MVQKSGSFLEKSALRAEVPSTDDQKTDRVLIVYLKKVKVFLKRRGATEIVFYIFKLELAFHKSLDKLISVTSRFSRSTRH